MIDDSEYILGNPWMSLDNLRMIADDMIMPIAEHKWGQTDLLKNLRRPHGGYYFKLIILPTGGSLRFFLDSGPTVLIYIRGLSFFGGDGIFTHDTFWTQLKDVLYQAPKLRQSNELIQTKIFERTGRRKFAVSKEHPFPDLIPANEIQITNITMEITAMHVGTGAHVKFHQPLDYVPTKDVERDAQIKLSMLVNEWEHSIVKE